MGGSLYVKINLFLNVINYLAIGTLFFTNSLNTLENKQNQSATRDLNDHFQGEKNLKLKRVVQHHILSSQLQQHRIIEKLVNRDILTETFPSTGLYHELSSQVSCWLRLQRSDYDAFVKGVTRNNLSNEEKINGEIHKRSSNSSSYSILFT